ncbi:MAG: RIP metalloprotease RseP [Pseudomonadota bacterium]
MEIPSGWFGFGVPFLVILTVLVFVHELGHYLIARRNGVRVEVFSIGFGPEIFGWTDRARTRWKFSLIPLGGYVKMYGDADAASARADGSISELSDEEKAQAFPYKRLGQRAWIVAGGPLANFLFAIVVLAGLFTFVGQPFTPAVVGQVVPDSAAAEAGFQPNDKILEINAWGIDSFEDLQRIVSLSPGEPLEVLVERDGLPVELQVTPSVVEETDNFGNVNRIGRLGISRSGVDYIKRNPLSALYWATEETWSITMTTLKAVGQIITGSRSAAELGGPLRIAKMSGQVAETGMVPVIWFIAVLSINLGLINLFPIPMLDGGHLLFYAIEAVRGKPLGMRAQEYGLRIGLALVLGLMVFATWNDIVHHVKIFDFLRDLVT